MSVRFNQRAIVRLIHGDLSSYREARLRRHLRRCVACAKRYEELQNVARFLGQAPEGTRWEKERARASLQASLDKEIHNPPANSRSLWWLAGAGFVVATGAFVVASFSRSPSVNEHTAVHVAARPKSHTIEDLSMPVVPLVSNEDDATFGSKQPFEGELPKSEKRETIRSFNFEDALTRHPEWSKGTVKRCPIAKAGTRCIVAWRALPCCPYAGQVTWSNPAKGAKIFTYADDLVLTFRYWTGASTSSEPLDMQLQLTDAADHYFSFPFKAKARAAWQQATIPLAWLRSNPGIMVGFKVAKPGPSMPIPVGAAIRSLQVMLRYSREDVLLIDDVELFRNGARFEGVGQRPQPDASR